MDLVHSDFAPVSILARSMLSQPRDIKDLRNMREHVVDYFKGDGLVKKRWTIETPEYKADASAFIGALIGGRLDWSAFRAAAQRLLPRLLAEPIPFPSLANMPPHHQNQPYLYAYSNPLISCSRATRRQSSRG